MAQDRRTKEQILKEYREIEKKEKKLQSEFDVLEKEYQVVSKKYEELSQSYAKVVEEKKEAYLKLKDSVAFINNVLDKKYNPEKTEIREKRNRIAKRQERRKTGQL